MKSKRNVTASLPSPIPLIGPQLAFRFRLHPLAVLSRTFGAVHGSRVRDCVCLESAASLGDPGTVTPRQRSHRCSFDREPKLQLNKQSLWYRETLCHPDRAIHRSAMYCFVSPKARPTLSRHEKITVTTTMLSGLCGSRIRYAI